MLTECKGMELHRSFQMPLFVCTMLLDTPLNKAKFLPLPYTYKTITNQLPVSLRTAVFMSKMSCKQHIKTQNSSWMIAVIII